MKTSRTKLRGQTRTVSLVLSVPTQNSGKRRYKTHSESSQSSSTSLRGVFRFAISHQLRPLNIATATPGSSPISGTSPNAPNLMNTLPRQYLYLQAIHLGRYYPPVLSQPTNLQQTANLYGSHRGSFQTLYAKSDGLESCKFSHRGLSSL